MTEKKGMKPLEGDDGYDPEDELTNSSMNIN